MVALLVEFSIQPGREADFDRLTAALLPQLNECEPGTLVYVPLTSSKDQAKRVFVELYRDEAAFQRHETAPHTQIFLAERTMLLAQPPLVQRLADAGIGAVLRAGTA